MLEVVASTTAFPDTDATPIARPFAAMPLAIDVRECWVVGAMVSKGVGGNESLPARLRRLMLSVDDNLSRLPG
jgi:hypothetical protein